MDKNDGLVELGLCRRQSSFQISENHMADIWNGVWMRSDLTIEDEDFVVRQAFAKMVVGSAVAKAQLQYDTRAAANHRHRGINAATLRL